MAPPTQETITAAIAALRADAADWLSSAADLAGAGDAAAGLTLRRGELSAMAEATGLTGVYAALQEHVAARLGEAARAGSDTAAALGQAAEGYERDEHDAVHRLRGIW
jgi:hypothetical protein